MNASTPYWVYLLLLLSVGCSSAAQIFQKLAANALKQPANSSSGLAARRNILLSILFLGAGLLLWLLVLGKLELSVAYPMLSLSYIVVMLLARQLFAETIPPRRWLGTGFIMAGTLLLAGGAR